MGENKKGIEYYLEKLTEMSDVLESSDIFVNSDLEVNIRVTKDEYIHLKRYFRRIGQEGDEIKIQIGDTKFNLTWKN